MKKLVTFLSTQQLQRRSGNLLEFSVTYKEVFSTKIHRKNKLT